ncbi:unnamed protein product [Sphagnum tenellum]
MAGTRRGRVMLPQYVVIRSSWCLGLLLVALMAGVKLSHQVPTTTDVGVSDNVPQDDFAAWLQEMAETSDSDSDDETTPGAADTGSDDIPNLTAGEGGEKRGKDDDDKKDKHHSSSSSSGKGSSSSKAPKENYDSIGVKPPPTGKPKKITVGKDGKGDFKTINEALNSIKPGATYRTIIKIKAGVYEEKVTINSTQPYITFLGEGMNETIITWNDTAGDFDDADVLLKTYRSATVGISSEWFIAKGVQFRNSAPQPAPGAVLKQAVAMRISADRAAFYNCSFYGFQDTLYDHNGRHYFESSLIVGSIDFIFGNGRSLYRGCHLLEVADSFGSLSAQKRNESRMHTGFSFLDCRVDGQGLQIYLGRAWGNFSRTVYSYTYMNDIIYPGGWSDFGFPQRDHQVFFGQYKCYGPGANTSQRVPWAMSLTPTQAKPFLSVNFINGKSWLTSYIKKPKFT